MTLTEVVYTSKHRIKSNLYTTIVSEIIYVLTNKAMPGLVKIGITKNSLTERISSLNRTNVPYPFECYFAAEVENCTRLEKILHQLFSENRANEKREFFEIEPERIALAIQIGEFTDVTPGALATDENQKEMLEKNNDKARRSKINLENLGIKEGDILTFQGHKEITATVLENERILYRGKSYSLSKAAREVRHSLGYKYSSISGSRHWMYNGELLDDLRRRLETKRIQERT